MPQNEYMELHKKRYGQRFDFEEKKRKVSWVSCSKRPTWMALASSSPTVGCGL